MARWSLVCWSLGLSLLAGPAGAQTIPVADTNQDDGTGRPVGWTLSGGEGQWLPAGDDGQRALTVRGAGDQNNYWRSATLPLESESVYQVRYRVRRVQGSGGTAITGPVFANEDIGSGPVDWTTYTQIFRTPRNLSPEDAWLRFGQWHIDGELAFKQVELLTAMPLYRTVEGLTLGAGEALKGHDYTFDAPLTGPSNNDSRALAWHTAGFNSLRWVFGQGAEVVYRHELGDRTLSDGKLRVDIGYYAGGQLAVEASPDGQNWTVLGTLSDLGSLDAELPAGLLPAREVWVRLRGETRQRVGTESDPGAFQVHGYHFSATVDGPAVTAQGETHYLAVPQASPAVRVAVESLGDGLPGGANTARLVVTNPGAAALQLTPRVAVNRPGEALTWQDGAAIAAAPGQTALTLPYELPGTGAWDIHLGLGGIPAWEAIATVQVAELYNTDFGSSLPGSTADVALWGCESGWKVSQTRPAPTATAPALVIRAARNEAEAAQVVVRPQRDLTGLTAQAGTLTGPGGATIAADRIDLLRVRYVNITQPTDRLGVAAPWPDPLPPLTAPLDCPANLNQPLWVRVNVPADAVPGNYTGTLQLAAEGYQASVPLAVTVYGFDIPTRSTLVTAFGISSGRINQYHGLKTPEQQREVWEKYLASYSAHHISPYNPVPYDNFIVRWEGGPDYQGGQRDTTEKVTGESSLKVVDDSETATRSAAFQQVIPIPEGGLTLSLDHKAEAGQRFHVSLNHSDGNGNWMSGRNNDLQMTGTGAWTHWEQAITSFPEGAKTLKVTLYPCPYRDNGETTGTVWFDNFKLTATATGEALIDEGFEPKPETEIRAVIDWTAFDREMTRVMETYGFNSFRLPILGLGGGTFHARYEPVLAGYTEDSPQYAAMMADYLGQLQAHLEEKGWLDKAYVYWFDEPDPKDYEFVLNGFQKLVKWAPKIPRMLTEQPEPGLFGGPDIWCPVSSSFDMEAAQERMDAGDKFWWYVCTGPKAPYATLFIDHPGTELRAWCWQTWERKIEGILVWESNYWHSGVAYPDSLQNPYLDPMSWVTGYDTPVGTKRPWGNGDGRFVYPPEAAAAGNPAEPVLDGPVDSIRFEMLRDGIEDYEYLHILRELLAARGQQLTAADRARYEALLEVPETISVSATEFTSDPRTIEARRHELAQAIEALSQK